MPKKKKELKPRPIRMEDLAEAAGMSIEDFFRSEVLKHGSVYAASKFHKMNPSGWSYWKDKLKIEIEVQKEVIISPKN